MMASTQLTLSEERRLEVDLAELSTEFRRRRRQILKGIYPRRFRVVLRTMEGALGCRVIDVGGAEGTMAALLYDHGAARVILVDPSRERTRVAAALHEDRGIEIVTGDILDHLERLHEADTVIALRTIHRMGAQVHALFGALRDSGVQRVVLQGCARSGRRFRETVRSGAFDLEGGVLALPEGMRCLVETYGFTPVRSRGGRHPIVVARRAA